MFNIDFSSFSLKKFKEQGSSKKKMIIGGVIVLLLLIVAFIQVMDSFSFVFSGKTEIVQLQSDIKKLQAKLQVAQDDYSKVKALENEVLAMKDDYWLPEKEGNINALTQNRVQTAASECSVELRSTGTIQMNTVSEGISTAQFDIACAGDMKSIANFIYKLSTSHPKMYWDRCSLRSDDIKNFSKLYFSASLTFICLENKQLRSLFSPQSAEPENVGISKGRNVGR